MARTEAHFENFARDVERGARSAAQWVCNAMVTAVSRPHPQAPKVPRYAPGSPVGTPPYMRTGRGRESLGWNVKTEGREVVIRLGVDASAPGGMKSRTYMFGHEEGIRGKQRPWLQPTLKRYAGPFVNMIFAGAR